MNRFKKGHISVAVVCAVLGFMISLQFRIFMEQKASLPYQRIEELSSRLLDVERERDKLQEKLSALEEAAEKGEANSLSDQKASEILRQRAGLVAMEGPGVIVLIDDSRLKSKAGDNQNLYIIHDDDLLRVVNELRAAGAEVISINGQRIIATSEIRCAGPTLSVNNVRSAPPYEIHAIGDAATLENALKMRGGVMETLAVWGIQLEIQASENVSVCETGRGWCVMISAVCGLIIGLVLGAFCPLIIPVAYSKLFSVALLACLDSVFGGYRSVLEDKFDNTIFISGFFTNALLAAFLVYVGDHLSIDLYYVALLTFGFRIFQNLAIIRRYFLKKH